MTTEQIKEQAETIEATVSQDNANLQEAVQGLASLVAELAGTLSGVKSTARRAAYDVSCLANSIQPD